MTDPTKETAVSETPETDAQPGYAGIARAVKREFAKTLERRLNAALAELERVRGKVTEQTGLVRHFEHQAQIRAEDNAKLEAELATLRAELERVREERDSWRTEAAAYKDDSEQSEAYIRKLGRLLKCSDGDDLPEDRIAALRSDLEASQRREGVLREHLGNMLDEVRTTKRGDWPRDLFCIECDCNISKVEAHKPNCRIGRANEAWDAAALAAGSEG